MARRVTFDSATMARILYSVQSNKALNQIDCAFLPMNIPYTMTPEMVADAAKAFRPKELYAYHIIMEMRIHPCLQLCSKTARI